MHGSTDKHPRESHGVYRNWTIQLFALPILFLVALIGFAVTHPGASRWISDAVEAEYVGAYLAPAKPASEVQTAKVH